MSLMDFGPAWFALQVRAGHEKLISLMIRHKGYEDFLPLRRERRRWSDRFKEFEIPLFQGYVFCRFNPSASGLLVTTPGIVRVVGIGKTPVPISDNEIDVIQALVRSGLGSTPYPFLRDGQRVRIECGPLEGTEGILLRNKSSNRLIVSISLLQRSVAVEVDEAWIAPLH